MWVCIQIQTPPHPPPLTSWLPWGTACSLQCVARSRCCTAVAINHCGLKETMQLLKCQVSTPKLLPLGRLPRLKLIWSAKSTERGTGARETNSQEGPGPWGHNGTHTIATEAPAFRGALGSTWARAPLPCSLRYL